MKKYLKQLSMIALVGLLGVNAYMANDLFSSGDLNLKSIYSLADALAEEGGDEEEKGDDGSDCGPRPLEDYYVCRKGVWRKVYIKIESDCGETKAGGFIGLGKRHECKVQNLICRPQKGGFISCSDVHHTNKHECKCGEKWN